MTRFHNADVNYTAADVAKPGTELGAEPILSHAVVLTDGGNDEVFVIEGSLLELQELFGRLYVQICETRLPHKTGGD